MDFKNLINVYNLKIRGVLHIGAHYGQEYADYVEHGIENVIFFEPLKNNYSVLLNNVKLTDNIKAYNIALGNIVGEVEMFVDNNVGASSSVLEPEIHLTQYPQYAFNRKEIVKINKLDNVVYDRNIFNFINVDVQGYELEVFKGAVDSLKCVDYIMTEINNVHLYKNGALDTELDLFLSNFGFVRVETKWATPTWGDALYIKKENEYEK